MSDRLATWLGLGGFVLLLAAFCWQAGMVPW